MLRFQNLKLVSPLFRTQKRSFVQVGSDSLQKVILYKEYYLEEKPNMKPKAHLLESSIATLAKMAREKDPDSQSAVGWVIAMARHKDFSSHVKGLSESVLSQLLCLESIGQAPADTIDLLLRYYFNLHPTSKSQLRVIDNIFKARDLWSSLPPSTLVQALGVLAKTETDASKIQHIILNTVNSTPKVAAHPSFGVLLNKYCLKKFWSKNFGLFLLSTRAITYKLFKFLVEHEYGGLALFAEKVSKEFGTNVDRIAQQIGESHLAYIYSTNSAWSLSSKDKAFSKLPIVQALHKYNEEDDRIYNRISKNSVPLGAFSFGEDFKELKQYIDHVHTLKQEEKGVQLETLRRSFKGFMLDAKFSDPTYSLFDVLTLIVQTERLEMLDYTKVWTPKIPDVKARLSELSNDPQVFIECSTVFFHSKLLADNCLQEYHLLFKDFVRGMTVLEHSEDTREKLWVRTLPELYRILDGIAPFEKIMHADFENKTYNSYFSIISTELSNALIDYILHPEFVKQLESYLDLSFIDRYEPLVKTIVEESEEQMEKNSKEKGYKGNKGQRKSEVMKEKAEKKTAEMEWRDFETISKVNETALEKWDAQLSNRFIQIYMKMVRVNIGTKKFHLGAQRAIEKILSKVDASQIGSLLGSLADAHFITLSLKEAIAAQWLESLGTTLKGIRACRSEDEYYTDLVNIGYFMLVNKIYTQPVWNDWSAAASISETKTHSFTNHLKPDSAMLLGQLVLLIRMEIPFVNTLAFDSTLPNLITLNQTDCSLFPNSQFSQHVHALLKKFYYDYLEVNGTAEIFRVSSVQGKHAVLCFDESHFLSSSGIIKGRVHLAIRILNHLKFTVHVINKRKYAFSEKRSQRLEYLRSQLAGIDINEKRRVEVETTPFFN
jgi:hypothetical protein